MPSARYKRKPKPAPRKRRGSKFICPECGFKAAHAMGLGRHRTSRHGVPSKASLAARRVGRSTSTNGAVMKRLRDLEQRQEGLIKALRRALR